MANRLAGSTSPYLQQHRDNPVDWWEWGSEAFVEAQRRDVPVLLSVGYAACHWCHVMAHESFEDEGVAAVVNASFVAVKVDREERPDVDATYMAATQAMTGHGGWPMTVFCTPHGRPFHAGTYYPPTPRQGIPSFSQLLDAVAQAWANRRDDVHQAAERLGQVLLPSRPDATVSSATPLDATALDATALDAAALEVAVHAMAAEEDREGGGFGQPPGYAPKFPNTPALLWLLRHTGRTGPHSPSGSLALAMVERSMSAMWSSGTYDQLGGGFARYGVDRRCVVPHFEKMLDDNALLARAALHLWRLTGSPDARRVAQETCDFLVRDLRTAQGGFATSLDADTSGVEGLTYVWSPDQLVEALGARDGAWVGELCGVTATGTYEHGMSTLQLTRPLDPVDADRWAPMRARLLAARRRRPQPARDDKVVTSWTALAVAALAEGGALLERTDLVEAAAAAADLLVTVHLRRSDDGSVVSLARASRDGAVGPAPGVLEDHACLADALLVLHGVTGEARWVAVATALMDRVLTQFLADGELVDTAADTADALLVAVGGRGSDPTDGVRPSGAAAAAGAWLHLAAITGQGRYREAAERVLARVAPLAVRAPRFAAWTLAVAEAALDGPREVAVVGPGGDRHRRLLHHRALMAAAPGLVVTLGTGSGDDEDETVPLLRARTVLDGVAAAYVCRGFVCDAPTTDPDVLDGLLAPSAAAPPG